MEKSTKIALIISAFVLAGAGVGYYFYHKKKKNGINQDVVSGADLSKNSSTQKTSEISSQLNTPEIQELNTEIAKVYYAMEILENRNGVIYNTTTGKPLANDLDKATWIQLKKKTGMIQNDFTSTPRPKKIMGYGNILIDKLNADIDKIFPPAVYNTNTDWYKLQA